MKVALGTRKLFARTSVRSEEIDVLIVNCSIFTPTPVFVSADDFHKIRLLKSGYEPREGEPAFFDGAENVVELFGASSQQLTGSCFAALVAPAGIVALDQWIVAAHGEHAGVKPSGFHVRLEIGIDLREMGTGDGVFGLGDAMAGWRT